MSCTYSLWLFAAQHSFNDLELYCQNTPEIWESILKGIAKPGGLNYLLNEKRVPLACIQRIVSKFIGETCVGCSCTRLVQCGRCKQVPVSFASGFSRAL